MIFVVLVCCLNNVFFFPPLQTAKFTSNQEMKTVMLRVSWGSPPPPLLHIPHFITSYVLPNVTSAHVGNYISGDGKMKYVRYLLSDKWSGKLLKEWIQFICSSWFPGDLRCISYVTKTNRSKCEMRGVVYQLHTITTNTVGLSPVYTVK